MFSIVSWQIKLDSHFNETNWNQEKYEENKRNMRTQKLFCRKFKFITIAEKKITSHANAEKVFENTIAVCLSLVLCLYCNSIDIYIYISKSKELIIFAVTQASSGKWLYLF